MLLESGHICFLKSQGMNYELIALTYLYKASSLALIQYLQYINVLYYLSFG